MKLTSGNVATAVNFWMNYIREIATDFLRIGATIYIASYIYMMKFYKEIATDFLQKWAKRHEMTIIGTHILIAFYRNDLSILF